MGLLASGQVGTEDMAGKRGTEFRQINVSRIYIQFPASQWNGHIVTVNNRQIERGRDT